MENLIFPLSKKEAEKKGIPYSSEANREAIFPTRLRALRRKKGVSQQQLADEIGVTKSTISLYEQGDNVPDVKNLFKIAKFYDVSFDFLMCVSDVTKRENIDIAEETGLFDEAIATLKLAKKAIDSNESEASLIFALRMLILNKLLSIDNFLEYAEPICNYMSLKMEFEKEVSEREKPNTFEDIGFQKYKDKQFRYHDWNIFDEHRRLGHRIADELLRNSDVREMVCIDNEYYKKNHGHER